MSDIAHRRLKDSLYGQFARSKDVVILDARPAKEYG